ncbi:flagellar assembly protein T N-terminal domain-containing protein [Geomonas sp. RF6]|uniref:flagellar assembly protein T N-terminal domain-containing protein n=1 Tax=Geomonas sp. RF6 TaxID=2897342 RepID=UPI001E4BB700|nr:flagellar assembly protein T N-terminal domain-containing protein [Geomonas sp. RF6]UFS70736.1 flagellar assembly protein T N-terminal domain-containing protein [Geomonas sp. RF6]
MAHGYTGVFLCIVMVIFALAADPARPSSALAAREETVEARGTALIAGRKDQARDQALSAALRQAVRQAVGVMVESESLVRNEILVSDQVLSRSNGFIKKYSILHEGVEDDTYAVDIRAVVSEVKLRKALGGIGVSLRQMGKPRIMLQLTDGAGEAHGLLPAGGAKGVVEARICDLLLAKGFELSEGANGLATGPHGRPSARTADAIAKASKSGAAEILFTGSVSSRSASAPISGTSLHPCQASVSVKAVNADSGEVLASHSAHAAVPHINPAAGEAEALGKAAEEVAESLSRQILANWKRKVEGTRTVRLVVSGLGGYDDLKSLKTTLKEKVEDLEDIWERGFEGHTANIDLEVTSSSSSLAEQLSALSVRGQPIEVVSFTPNVLQLTLRSKNGAAK